MSRTPAVAAPAAPVPAPVSTPVPAPVSGIAGKREMITGLLWDVGGSVATYYVLHALGFGDWFALLAAAAFAGGRIVWVAVRDRDLNAFASIMLLVWAAGLLLSFLSGDARFLLVKESATTAVVGLAFLASIAAGRPLTLAALKSWNPAQVADLDRQFRTVPAARRAFFVTSAVWGVGLVADALVRIPLIYALPVDVMVGLSTAIMIAAFVLLGAWNGWYTARIQRRSQAA